MLIAARDSVVAAAVAQQDPSSIPFYARYLRVTRRPATTNALFTSGAAARV